MINASSIVTWGHEISGPQVTEKKEYYKRNVENYAMKPTFLSRLQYLVQL